MISKTYYVSMAYSILFNNKQKGNIRIRPSLIQISSKNTNLTFDIFLLFQAIIAGMITLFFDGILPFIIILIMNALIIRALKPRHRELDSFTDEEISGTSTNNDSKSGKIVSCNGKSIYILASWAISGWKYRKLRNNRVPCCAFVKTKKIKTITQHGTQMWRNVSTFHPLSLCNVSFSLCLLDFLLLVCKL